MLAATVRMAKENGIDAPSPRAETEPFRKRPNVRMGKKQLIQSAQNDPMLNSILQDTGRGSIQQQEKHVAAMQAQIDAKISLDEKQLKPL